MHAVRGRPTLKAKKKKLNSEKKYQECEGRECKRTYELRWNSSQHSWQLQLLSINTCTSKRLVKNFREYNKHEETSWQPTMIEYF